eukprot:3341750-Amphidinium_carterae.1
MGSRARLLRCLLISGDVQRNSATVHDVTLHALGAPVEHKASLRLLWVYGYHPWVNHRVSL